MSTANTSVDGFADSLDIIQNTTALHDVRDKAKDVKVLPIVDLWYDLTARLTQEEIPSPLEFYRERHEIVKIVREARKRTAARPFETAIRPGAVLEAASGPLIKDKPRSIHPMKNLCQLRQRVMRVQLLPVASPSATEAAEVDTPETKPRRLRRGKNLRQMRERVVTIIDPAVAAARPVRFRFPF